MSAIYKISMIDLYSKVSFGGGGGGGGGGGVRHGRNLGPPPSFHNNRPRGISYVDNTALCIAGTAAGGAIATYAPHPAVKAGGIVLGAVTAGTVCREP